MLTCADEIIDLLLDQPGFECDPISRRERDTPLHTAIRWSNSEPPAQQPFAQALIEMMLEAGSNPRIKNKAGLTATQLVDPRYPALRQLIEKHEYTLLNAGDFVDPSAPNPHSKSAPKVPAASAPPLPPSGAPPVPSYDDDDDDAEFSGSDEDERAEWERQRRK